MKKTPQQIIINIFYGVGVTIFLVLAGIYLLGQDTDLYPDDMISNGLQHSAFMAMAFGAIPLIIVTLVFYNEVKKAGEDKPGILKRLVIFAPALLCSLCFLNVAGTLLSLYFRALHHIGM